MTADTKADELLRLNKNSRSQDIFENCLMFKTLAVTYIIIQTIKKLRKVIVTVGGRNVFMI